MQCGIVAADAGGDTGLHARGERGEHGIGVERAGGVVVVRMYHEAGQRRGQHVQAARTEHDVVAAAQRQGALIGLRARNLDARAGAIGQAGYRGGVVEQAQAQAFQRAGELDFLHHRAAEIAGRELVAAGGQFHFLRPQHGDDLVLPAAGSGLAPGALHGR